MRNARLLILALATAAFATACATPPAEVSDGTEPPPMATPGEPVGPPPPQTPMPKPAPPTDTAPGAPAMECSAKKISWAVGKPADAEMVERIRTETHSERARVLRPGMMVTMEFLATRVNIDVDDNNIVTNVRCG